LSLAVQRHPDTADARFILELGMPHLGRNNLSESALLKAIGHDRWMRVQELGGLKSAQIRDDAGARLYATFFFIDIHLRPDRPLASFGENDVLEFRTDLSHFGKSYLDGRHVLTGDDDAWIRSSNVFIYQERGPSKLSVSFPRNMDFTRIPELPGPPETLDICRAARARSAFLDPMPGDVPIFDGRRDLAYEIDADRDLNGAGLVYFANFVSFLELAERRVLGGLDDPPPPDLLDARSTWRRLIGYYGNAAASERLRVSLAARARLLDGAPDRRRLDLGFDYAIHRSSDDKLLVVSSARKIATMQRGSDGEAWALRRAANP
jgi:probable biosynthetic protein (TIGR04098 family)